MSARVPRRTTASVSALLIGTLVLGLLIGAQTALDLGVRLAAIAAVAGLLVAATAWLVPRWLAAPTGDMVDALAARSTDLQAATDEVVHDADVLATGTTRQASSIEEISATLEELASMTRRNADHAGETDRLMAETRDAVTQARRSIGRLFDAIQEITRSSTDTSRIVRTIDEIAFQTNLLALNAAVEAARAGQHGAGFAVVADEVRTLAQRAATAAKESSSLIEDTARCVVDAAALVADTRGRFDELDQHVHQSSGSVSQIAAASADQARGLEQLNVAFTDIDTVVQQTVSTANHVQAVARQISDAAHPIGEVVERLRVATSGVDRESDHRRRDVDGTVHLRIAITALAAESFSKWMAGRRPTDVLDFANPYATRPAVDFVLQLMALHAAGLDFDYDLRPSENQPRCVHEIVQGYADLAAETVWDVNVQDGLIATSPLIRNGEFEKGLYTVPANERMLHVQTLEALREFVGVTVVSWRTDVRTLQAMHLKRLEQVFNAENLYSALNQRRADFTLLEFAATPDMSVTRGGIKLVPVPGCKVSLPGSRSWVVSSASPHAETLRSALERGLQILRQQQRVERAFRESGFFNPRVVDWKRLL